MILMTLFAGKEYIDVENGFVDTVGEERMGWMEKIA